jgi:hypothetical protein
MLRAGDVGEPHRTYAPSSSSNRFLCFAGSFLLSAITRVAAGAIPDSRARRRAICPTSRTFFFRFFILSLPYQESAFSAPQATSRAHSAALRPRLPSVMFGAYSTVNSLLSALVNLFHCPPRLVDRLIRVGKRSRIRIRNVNLTKCLPPNLTRRLTRRPFRIVQRVVLVRVAVRPAIHRDSLNIARRIESSGTKHPVQVITDVGLEGLKSSGEQPRAPGPLLIARRKPRRASTCCM